MSLCGPRRAKGGTVTSNVGLVSGDAIGKRKELDFLSADARVSNFPQHIDVDEVSCYKNCLLQ